MLTIIEQRLLKRIHQGKELHAQRLDQYYFGYGANALPTFFSKRLKNYECLGLAKLDDHRLAFNTPCEYAQKGFGGIVPALGETVYGTLYRVSAEGLELLDILEWVKFKFYHRSLVEFTHEGKKIQAHVYYPTNPRPALYPSQGYLNYLIKAAKELNYPESYIQHLSSHEVRDKFELDSGFNLADPSKERLFPKVMYGLHDKLREKLCELI